MTDQAPDDLLRNRASRLLDGMFDEAENMLHNGSPPVKLALLKALVPAVVKALTTEEQVDGAAEMRESFEALRRQLVESIGRGEGPEVVEPDGPTVDEVPKPKGRRK